MNFQLVTRKAFLPILMLALIWLLLPLTAPAHAQTGTTLQITTVDTEIYATRTFTAEINITGADNLYGLQIDCQVDPTQLAWQSSQFGDFFTASLVGANSVDTEAGTWSGAISQKNPAPALSGDGLFATLTFEALTPGLANIVCEPLAVDRNGKELAVSMAASSIEILDTSLLGGNISGSTVYQGRQTHTGIAIEATGPLNKQMETDATGQFTLDDLSQGEYVVQADAPLHLPNCATVTLAGGETTALQPRSLAGGDTDDSNAIKINDATLVGSNFGLSATSSPAMNPNADINADGQVNVQDLSILGGNFGKEGCQTWPISSQSTSTS